MIPVDDGALLGYKFIDLFCGIGGFHLALSSFGAECVFASDVDNNARKVYKLNYGLLPYGDITKIKDEQIPAHDILCAGFPCQPFSISGNQSGFDHPYGKLFYQIIRIAQYHHPQIILLENVKNLSTHDDSKTIQEMRNELERIGYDVYDRILIASDFGIPQARERLYFVALNKELGIKYFSFPIGTKTSCCLSDILCDESDTYDVHVVRKHTMNKKPLHRKGLIQVARFGRGRQGERIYSPDGYSTTLSSQSGGLGGKTGMYLIDGTVRKLYPRECARLMGFPDYFQYAKDISVAYKQFGNSVVVDVLQYIVQNIISYIQGEKHE